VLFYLNSMYSSLFEYQQRLIFSGPGCPEFISAPGANDSEFTSAASTHIGYCPKSIGNVVAAICWAI
jgi:hypothetical protein